ncbi:serine/threonine protein kinase [Nonomuraea sp. 3-1Str]|uniref:serine/threonine-protein kinase n=1 Tax=Nonomuraea sp. 3-1Str TaxID=2929801 RepID=UPI0028595470|nr:serine/threonine-protein kinase [Nonomuraea sp. 3-1Str]MDR8411162.1 serine/threonine protein kinase [Nonomuraea sp. 3-1Str]
MNGHLSPDATSAQRRTIGPYVLDRRLGEGGMGIVYLARDGSGRHVALKVMRPELAAREEFQRRFRAEAEAARQVARFCTAAVLDVGLDTVGPNTVGPNTGGPNTGGPDTGAGGAQAYIATEYIDGPDLSAVVEAQGPMSGSTLEALAVGVATALSAIHGAGVVHRDLKPSNILLSPVGPRVIDFGIAQLADTLAGQGDTGVVVGTLPYMSPEQGRGERVTAAADVFAWGCVVTYAATGHPPFPGRSDAEILYRVAHHVPHLDGLDERLRPLVEQALDKDPARRPTAQQLLDRLLGRDRVTAEAATRLVTAGWDVGTPVPRPVTDRPPRRWLVPLLVAVTAVAVSAAVLALTLYGGRERPGGGAPTAGRDLQVDGVKLHVEVASLTREGRTVTLQWSVRNAGDKAWNPWTAFGTEPGSKWQYNSTAGVMLVAPATGRKYGPVTEGDTCSCSPTGNPLRPGDTAPYYSLFTGVPEDADRIGVQIPSVGYFADVPIE